MPARFENLADSLVGRRINRRNPAVLFAKAHKNFLGRGVVAHVVGVLANLDCFAQSVRCAVIDVHFPISSIGHVKLVKVRHVERPLRLAEPLNAMDHLPENTSMTSNVLFPNADTKSRLRFASAVKWSSRPATWGTGISSYNCSGAISRACCAVVDDLARLEARQINPSNAATPIASTFLMFYPLNDFSSLLLFTSRSRDAIRKPESQRHPCHLPAPQRNND